ncbi:MAG: hypothetical protein K6C10_06660 [Prevotella sp.]|nr:hypothetical protein [Prevotella sp.]
MTRRINLLLAFLLLTGIANAQGLLNRSQLYLGDLKTNSSNYSLNQKNAPKHAQQKKAIEVGENQMWWGYYQGEEALAGMGVNSPDSYLAAIGLTPDIGFIQGTQIKAVRFKLAGTDAIENCFVWISKTLPTASSSNYVKIPVSKENLVSNSYIEVETEPYIIGNQTVYVGIGFEITDTSLDPNSGYPVLITNDGTNIPNALLFYTRDRQSSWLDPADGGNGYGQLALQVLLEGEFTENAASIGSFLDVFSLANGKGDATVELTNQGVNDITNIDYTITDGNGEVKEYHLDLPEPCKGKNVQPVKVKISMDGDAAPGRTARTIKITKVNGVDNANTSSTAQSSGYMITLSEFSPKRTLVEEFTGTWCGWCPRGTTALEMLNEKYPDGVVTIAIHNDDPMTINYGVDAPSFPYGMVNRTTSADPYTGVNGEPFGIADLVEEYNEIPAEASVELGDLTLAANGRISVNTKVTFRYNSETAPYALAYVLVADSLTGSTRSWYQANYYCRPDYKDYYMQDPNLRYWAEQSSYVNMAYNHVAIASRDVASGITNSIKAPIVDGATQTHSTVFSLAGNQLTQNINKLSVVAILLNTTTGTVVNSTIKHVDVAENFPVNNATIGNFPNTGVVLGTKAQIPVTVTTTGSAGVHSLDYTVRAGRVESDPVHIELDEPLTGYGMSRDIVFEVPSDTITGLATRYIYLRKINGVDNETKNENGQGKIITMLKESKKMSVVEEFTGTWCGWCPRGTVSMNHVAEQYADEAVALAIHGGNGDPMQVNTYSSQLNGMSMPTVWVNRYIKPNDENKPDVYYGYGEGEWGLGKVIDDENKKLVEAGIELSTPILDEETGIISFSTDVTFQLNRRNAPYGIAYALIADGLSGEGSVWDQMNYYPALYTPDYFSGDPEMASWTTKDITVTNMVYDHVVIDGLGVTGGVASSLASKVEEGQVQTHSAQFNIKNNALAKKATKLMVAAMLYDRERGAFINADRQNVLTQTEGIEETMEQGTDAVKIVAYYSLDGKRLQRPQKGINIVKMNNGEVRKIVVNK